MSIDGHGTVLYALFYCKVGLEELCFDGTPVMQVGSADHHIHYYDLRNVSQPVHVFGGHKKAVSYVKFLSTNELASASTDSTLRLWDVKDSLPVSNLQL